MKRLKILHLDPDDMDSPASGGGPVRTFEIYRRLARRHDITVLTPSWDGAEREVLREGVRYVRLGGKFRNHKSTYFWSYYFSAPFSARKYECDLLVEDLMPPTSATLTPLLNRKKIIASVQWFFAREWYERWKIPFHWYQPFGLKFYKHFIVLTEDMKEKILSFNPKAEICLIPNGINYSDVDVLPGGNVSPPAEPFILYLGRIEFGQKGVDLLLRAFQRIASKTAVKLVVAGSGVDLDKAQKMVHDEGLDDRVIFTGKVGLPEKNALFAKCLFVCVPSRFETFCMVALEAFARRKTVLAFDIPFLDVVKKTFAVKVPPFDLEAYSAQMETMILNSRQTEAWGTAAGEYAQNLTWDKLALAQEAYYERVWSEP